MKSVEIFLFEGANGLDVMGPLEVFATATQLLRRRGQLKQGYQLSLVAKKAGPVKLESGVSLVAEKSLSNHSAPDYFIVPGGMLPLAPMGDDSALNKIRKKSEKAKQLVSICTGAFVLAEAGLLTNRRCTTHWAYSDQLSQQHPSLKVNTDAIYVEDGTVYTSAGVTAGIDLALALVEKDYSANLAIEVARYLVLYLRRPGSQSQFSTPMELHAKAGDTFDQLHNWVLNNIDDSLTVENLADYVAMSPRNFARLFASKTGITPGRYIELIRIEKAKELLSHTEQTVNEIASLSGFHREERMRRAFVRNLGITPTQYRCHFSAVAV